MNNLTRTIWFRVITIILVNVFFLCLDISWADSGNLRSLSSHLAPPLKLDQTDFKKTVLKPVNSTSLVVPIAENIGEGIDELLNRVRIFSDSVNNDDFLSQTMHSEITGDLYKILKFLDETNVITLSNRTKISRTAYEFLQKLKTINPMQTLLVFFRVIEIIGKAGIDSPEIKKDLLELFRGWDNYSEPTDSQAYLKNSYYAAEALGRLYGQEVLQELLEYRGFKRYDASASERIGEFVEVHRGAVLKGAMLGF
ncbi:MAG: hypothetical protein ABH952_05715 [Candidatus Omnitrophota bacterium]